MIGRPMAGERARSNTVKDIIRAQPADHDHRRTDPGELADHGEHAKLAAVMGPIPDEVAGFCKEAPLSSRVSVMDEDARLGGLPAGHRPRSERFAVAFFGLSPREETSLDRLIPLARRHDGPDRSGHLVGERDNNPRYRALPPPLGAPPRNFGATPPAKAHAGCFSSPLWPPLTASGRLALSSRSRRSWHQACKPV